MCYDVARGSCGIVTLSLYGSSFVLLSCDLLCGRAVPTDIRSYGMCVCVSECVRECVCVCVCLPRGSGAAYFFLGGGGGNYTVLRA